MSQLSLFSDTIARIAIPPLAFTPEILAAIAINAPVAIGVSGGKDSSAAAIATINYLNAVGHTGDRILIHADLGRVEWKDSIRICRELAIKLKTELVVVSRKAGDMVDRWLSRWDGNVERYADLSCVKLILPWSTPSMRFCTSEMKTTIIWRELVRRWGNQTIISVVGIRRQESSGRAKKPVVKPKLKAKKKDTDPDIIIGLDWNAIIEWKETDVWFCHDLYNLPRHEAYTKYGSTRVSCAFCVLASKADLWSSSTCADNADLYRELVDLEIISGFSFQDKQWLGDIAPMLLSSEARAGLNRAKRIAQIRQQAEARIPEHLLFEKGWPNVMPTRAEAESLAEVRILVANASNLIIGFTDADSILDRYEQLMIEKVKKGNPILIKPSKAPLLLV